MERCKKARTPLRASLTKTFNEVEQELSKSSPDQGTLRLKQEKLVRIITDVRELDRKILDYLLDDDCSDDEYAQESAHIENYEDKFSEVKQKITDALPTSRPVSPAGSENSTATSTTQRRKTVTLPKIELPKFNGELKNWLGFWSQFQKIHEDEDIEPSDKFQYLLQSMTKESRARDLVESYPQTAENYPSVITALKNRFGKDELLIEVYVRELLKLVINNVSHTKDKFVLSKMYDKLESQLRALESLGVTMEKYAAMLYPMVESSLPESVLVAWQRNPLSRRDGSKETPQRTRLSFLMEFLQNEVEGEERILLARTGFGVSATKEKGRLNKGYPEEPSLPTAAGLFSGEEESKQHKCVFCDQKHDSRNCFKAQKMSINDKRTKLRSKKCCYACFRPNHIAKNCKAFLRCQECKRNHHVLMCPEVTHIKEKLKDEPTDTAGKGKTSSLSNQTCTGDVLLQTIVVRIVGLRREKLARALIDTGSQRSYMLTKTAEEMGYEPTCQENIIHSLFGGTVSGEQQHYKYQVCLKNVDDSYTCHMEVLDQPRICGEIPRVRRGPIMKELKSKHIWINDCGDDCPDIEILLGADIYGKFITGSVVQLSSGLTAIETLFGWSLLGKISERRSNSTSAMIVTSMLVNDSSIAELWRLETLGICDPVDHKAKGEQDVIAWQHFLSTVSREENGRYQVSLPWISESKEIPDNRAIAEKRLLTITRKLETTGRMQDYQTVFDEWLKEGIVEEVPTDEIDKPSHYLPHRPVYKDNSETTKVRPVFDASCKAFRSPCLNDCLVKGPNLLEQLPSILLRFRKGKIGVIADIRKAFLMIGVAEADRDYLRYLWWDDYEKRRFKVFRHRRVVFGLNCSPFLLGAVIKSHLSQTSEKERVSSEKLNSSLYVDNCVASVDTESELERFMQQATEILATAKLELRMWEHSFGATRDNGENLSTVLGLQWDRNRDVLFCDVRGMELPTVISKRTILSVTQRIFDPLGFLSPATLYPKLLLQEAWAKKVGWDDELPQEIQRRFQDWAKRMTALSDVRVERRVVFGKRESWSLHTFCDASSRAYATVVFLRCENEGHISVHMLQSRSRVAPLKKVSIPRLELLACTIGSRLTMTIKSAMDFADVPAHFWSDSTTALAWIKRNDEWGTFVGNRVREICTLTRPDHWRHIPGTMNPSDLPSRGCEPLQLLESKWWEGPDWLKLAEGDWPMGNDDPDERLVQLERKKTSLICTAVDTHPLPWYMKWSSKYSRIVRVMAWVQRFIQKVKKESLAPTGKELSVDEIGDAEKTLLRMMQEESFPNQEVGRSLQVEKDKDGLIRVKTRITAGQEPFNFSHPILLPTKHPLVSVIIKEEHQKSCHAGTQFLMTKLRERFWIIQSRRVIKGVVFKCVICRRFDSKHHVTDSPPLPVDRVTRAAIFEVIGVDLAGPLYLKDGNKVWIVLFTCAVYRAVHLELVTSLSTEGFLQALRRFVARRGRPKVIYSDNGTNFKGADNLFRSLDWERLSSLLVADRIKWKFNPPTAAWWGGWWERLIRVVKNLLVRVLGKSSLDYIELYTVLCDAEAVVNGRPLTYVSADETDLTPLTPSMFLIETREAVLPEVDAIEGSDLRRRYRCRQRKREEFKSRFHKEYLGQLVQRFKETEGRRSLKVGDVVLVEGDSKKRLLWPMAKIVKLVPGKDGQERIAHVKTTTGVLVRPVQRLFPLEVSAQEIQTFKPRKHEDPPAEAGSTDEQMDVVRTRFGRVTKAPDRLVM